MDDSAQIAWELRNIRLKTDPKTSCQRENRTNNLIQLSMEYGKDNLQFAAINHLLYTESKECPVIGDLKLKNQNGPRFRKKPTRKFAVLFSNTDKLREAKEKEDFPLFKPKYSSNHIEHFKWISDIGQHTEFNNGRQFQSNKVPVPQKRKIDTTPEKENSRPGFEFRSARQQLIINQKKKNNKGSPSDTSGMSLKKSLGSRPRNPRGNKFVPPTTLDADDSGLVHTITSRVTGNQPTITDEDIDPRLQGIDPKIIELVTNEIMHTGPQVEWDDIAGLEFVKNTIKEIVVWPMLRPDIFTGLRGPAKGILLFGPPGTGKTLIGKCIANQSGATFFSISASSLTSKWVGEGEKMVRGLFAVAGCHQPAVIFIDEIDSLLSQRSDTEHESSRRIKTEFLVQLDGATTISDDRILVVGATNRPQELDEAARRRLVKRLYIPLPEKDARKQIVRNLLSSHRYEINDMQMERLVEMADGYSGADMANLCKEAALCPIRSLKSVDISRIRCDEVRPINFQDFEISLKRVRPSVSSQALQMYEEWDKQFGCSAF